MARTLIVGDVHGCLHELEEVLDAAAYAAGERVVLAGDLVAKGPDSRGVLALVRKLGARGVRGNHDHAVLRWREVTHHRPQPERASHHLQVARSLGPEDWDTLLGLPLFLRFPELETVVVHGGLVPGVPLEEQDPDMLMNMRTVRPDGTPSRRPEDGELWGHSWPGPELVVFGHHAMAGLQRHKHAMGLDTGCVYGGRLTLFALPEARLFSVPARAVYANADTERKTS